VEPPAQPQVEIKVSREQAIAIAHRYFTIPADLGEPNVSINQSAEGAFWYLYWHSDEKQPDQTAIRVSVDAVTGWVTSYSFWSTSPQSRALSLSYTRAEARALAEGWFAKLVPAEVRDSLRFADTPMSISYYSDPVYRFRWERIEQGYPVSGEGAYIAVDARSGDLVDYTLSWQHGRTYTAPVAVLTQDEAEAALRKHLGMALMYRYFTKPGTDEGEWRLVYAPTNTMAYVDQMGQPLNYDGTVAQPAPEPVPVDPSETPYQPPAGLLDRDAALAIAAAATGRTDPPSSSAYDETGTEVKQREWSFSWRSENDSVSATVNAETGVLTRMYFWTRDDDLLREGEEPQVSAADAQATAIAFVQKFRPDLAGRIVYRPESEQNLVLKRIARYHFGFGVLQNGLPVEGRNISVEVDARTGVVREFYSSADFGAQDEFPAAEGVIGVDEALDAYLAATGVRLAWVSLRSNDPAGSQPPQLLWEAEGRLPVASVDAHTGAPLDWQGRDVVKAAQRPVDIDGHYAEREIELLWSRGVFDLDDGWFRPDDLATAAELARWIVLAKGLQPYPAFDFAASGAGASLALQLSRSAESPYFGAAFRSGIMRPEDFPEGFDLSGPVSRELFALWAVRAMGYGRVAEMDARIALDFADAAQVGARYHNAVALLAGFGIVAGDGESNFHPQDPVTRGAAAKILFAVSAEQRY